MTDQTQLEAPIILTIPQPSVRRVIAIAAIGFFLAMLAMGPCILGFERFFESLFYFSATWILILMMSPPIAFFAWLAFPPRSLLPRLEISRCRIRVVPGRIARFFAETNVEIALAAQSREILLCHNVWQGLGDGLRLIVRAADGTEREIRATPMDYLNARNSQVLAEGVSAASGLPVRLLTRRRQADGTIREAPWNPQPRSAKYISGAALAMGAVPFVGGAVVGVIWPTPAFIVTAGLGLWLSQMGVFFLLARWSGSTVKFPTPYSLATVFTFAAAYALAVVMVGFLLMGR